MVNFVFLSIRSDDLRNYFKRTKLVQAGPYETIFVPHGYLPIPVDSKTHKDPFGEFHDFPTDDDDKEIYFMIKIDVLYQKLMDFDTLPEIDLAENIDEHSDEEGWDWNIDTLKFDELPKPHDRHCWVNHTKSWELPCEKCFKPICHSVEILSEEICLTSLMNIYCDCKKCDKCGFIYDDKCKCRASTQKPSDASSDSHLVICEHCGRTYNAFDGTSQYIHDERCC
jgi:hypothetical protein